MDPTRLPAAACAQLLGPFRDSVALVLRETTGTEALARADQADLPACDLVVTLPLTAAVQQALVLGFPGATAWALARRFLAGVTDPDEELMRDSLGELANVMAGQAKALLHGTAYAFRIGTPSVQPAGPEFPPAGEPLTVAFDSDAGPFLLRLTLRLAG